MLTEKQHQTVKRIIEKTKRPGTRTRMSDWDSNFLDDIEAKLELEGFALSLTSRQLEQLYRIEEQYL